MINLMNYYEHPGDNRYYIFEYRDVEKSIRFEEYLDEYEIVFEKFVDEEDPNIPWKCLYAVSKSDFRQALRANSLTEAAYRQPMIGNIYLRYGFVILMLGVLVLALIGYIKSNG